MTALLIIFGVSFSILLTVAAAFYYLRNAVLKKLPTNAPSPVFLSKIAPNSRRIVFAGDSNTHANMSFNWTELINGDFVKINAGINADLSHNLLHRIDEIISFKPDIVCILIGTNDVNATMSSTSKQRYLSNGKIRVGDEVNIQSFRKNIKAIVSKVQNETRVKVALLSLPLIGEDLESEVNTRADEYSDVIQKASIDTGVTFIDIREKLKRYVKEHQEKRPPSYEKYYFVMLRSIFLHFYFGFTFDKLSRMNGMLLSHDQLHQNSISGRIIAKEVNKYLDKMG